MKISSTRRELLVFTAAVTTTSGLLVEAKAKQVKENYRDPALSVAVRVNDLLARMTLTEKVAQLRCMWGTKSQFYDDKLDFDPAKAAKVIPDGIGHLSRPTDIRGVPAWELTPFRSLENGAKFVNAFQRFLVEKTRLGIPALMHDELAHGLLAGEATLFPSPPALGSTWDPELVEKVFTVASREARVRGTTYALTPVIDLAKDPRFGRVEEMFGEDPYHVGIMGVAAVAGLQGRARPLAGDRVFATLKHFVHGSPQGGLNISPADMSERTLRAQYFVPFRKVIKAADPAIIMPSYNEVQGVPAHASVALLQHSARRLLGFNGVFFSDYQGIENLWVQHRVVRDLEDAAVLAMNAGVAVDLPEGNAYALLPKLVGEGRVDMAQIDDAVRRVLTLKFEAGLFENPYVDLDAIRRINAAPEHVALARKVADKSLVLLKNDGLLPLKPLGPFRLAVIGPNAEPPLFGGYSGDTARAIGILEGVRKGAPANVSVEYAEGVRITAPDAAGKHRSYSPLDPGPEDENRARITAARVLAERSDAVLLVLGDVPAVTREAVHITLPGDRNTLGLWGMQDALVEAIAATGKPVVALLINGRPLAVTRLVKVANALVEGWYLGEQGGPAFADMLFGRTNPGGKLAVTFPRSSGDLPVGYERHPSADTNKYLEGERGILFPFGHGLSYTTFEISAPRLSSAKIGPGEHCEIYVDVTNTGSQTGDEVVQLYITDEYASVPQPRLSLRAFKRVTVAPGATERVRLALEPDDLAIWDIDMKRRVEPGEFTIQVGPNSVDLKSVTLTVA